MATSSIFKNIVLDNKAAGKFCEALEKDSPCKDIQPVSYEELKESEELAKKWRSKHSH
jgi:hypothetical protein